MNYSMAIVISAALVAGAMFFSNQNDLGAAGNGEWAAAGVVTEGELPRVWAVNTQTGQMRMCGHGGGFITCINEKEHTLP